MTRIVVSVSGGKDSTATLLLAIERHGDDIEAAFADTGNEHPATYDYVRYLADATGVAIRWLRADFTEWWARRREYVRERWPLKGVPADVVERALCIFDAGPTGNPYLDLCVIKGRFPSRKAQFCTQHLKVEPITEFQLGLIGRYGAVESWQGIRAEESARRAQLPEREDRGGGLTIYRPVLRWTVEQVFEQHRKHGIKPNPLYTQGMRRVGCMPCINVAKDELLEIGRRFPEHIDRIAEWEATVGAACRLSSATFIASPGDNETAFERGNIRAKLRWAQTGSGGHTIDWIRLHEEPAQCASAYGLCE